MRKIGFLFVILITSFLSFGQNDEKKGNEWMLDVWRDNGIIFQKDSLTKYIFWVSGCEETAINFLKMDLSGKNGIVDFPLEISLDDNRGRCLAEYDHERLCFDIPMVYLSGNPDSVIFRVSKDYLLTRQKIIESLKQKFYEVKDFPVFDKTGKFGIIKEKIEILN